MRTRIIGDIHGDMYSYRMLIENQDIASIQLGDFGIGFHSDYWHDSVNDFHTVHNRARFIRGNHDDPQCCKNNMRGYIPDGTVENDIMFVGGAYSINRQYRTEGVDWWADEELSYAELDTLIDIYESVKPRIMISHDGPASAGLYMAKQQGSSTLLRTRTNSALQTMFELHQPQFWFFGHWHNTRRFQMFGTQFHCLGICDYTDFNLEQGYYYD